MAVSGAGAGGLKPSGLIHRRRFRSFPHPDLLSLPSTPQFHRSRSTPSFPSSASSADRIVKFVGGRRTAPGVHALVAEADVTMSHGARPVPAPTGLGGAYLLRDQSGDCLAVVKPITIIDPLALPRSSSVHAGETGYREAAAYLLDHAAFAGVPPTALIRISHRAFPPSGRVASIQRYIPHDIDAGNLGPSRFSVASVHRIGILDIRLLNTDRHAGNLLVQKERVDKNRIFNGRDWAAELVPIDHGLCLPELLDDPYFEWLHWPQAAMAFSDQETEYVSKLDPFGDAELLRAELPSIREPAIRILILCTIFLKRAVDFGLCLSEIGGMMTREFCREEGGESVLETLCKKTEEAIEAEFRVSEVEESSDFGEEFQFSMEDSLEEEEEERGGGMMVKSVSFSEGEVSCNGGRVERRKVISFKDKSEEEYMMFLERFEQLLPEAFEERKGMEMKPRLGSSCNF